MQITKSVGLGALAISLLAEPCTQDLSAASLNPRDPFSPEELAILAPPYEERLSTAMRGTREDFRTREVKLSDLVHEYRAKWVESESRRPQDSNISFCIGLFTGVGAGIGVGFALSQLRTNKQS